MYSSQTSIPTHTRASKAALFQSEHDHKTEETPRVFTDPQIPTSSEKPPPQRAAKEKAITTTTTTTTTGRRSVEESPNYSLESPHSLAPHAAMSSFSQAKSWENGAPGGDDDERKQRESHKKRSKNWTRPESLLLICLRTQLEPRFAKSGRKTELWDEIAESLQKENYTRDAQQCRDKWEKLTAGYKEVRDGVKDKEDNPFYDELHLLLSGKSMKREREKEREDYSSKEQVVREPPTKQDTAVVEEERLGPPKEDEEDEPARKKTRKFISVTDMEAVQSVLETVISRQQAFFRELLEAMEKKEQMRQEKEDRWRAEERAQRGVFNNAMIVLTQKLVGEQIGASLPPAATTAAAAAAAAAGAPSAKAEPAPLVGSPEGHQGAPKRRSKNWKRAEVLQLIKLRGEMDSRFAHSTRRAALWDELAERLLGQGINRDGKQCREKWDKLQAEYKDVTDGKRDQRESPYYAELVSILG